MLLDCTPFDSIVLSFPLFYPILTPFPLFRQPPRREPAGARPFRRNRWWLLAERGWHRYRKSLALAATPPACLDRDDRVLVFLPDRVLVFLLDSRCCGALSPLYGQGYSVSFV